MVNNYIGVEIWRSCNLSFSTWDGFSCLSGALYFVWIWFRYWKR